MVSLLEQGLKQELGLGDTGTCAGTAGSGCGCVVVVVVLAGGSYAS